MDSDIPYGTLINAGYRPRILDRRIAEGIEDFGAVCIEGPMPAFDRRVARGASVVGWSAQRGRPFGEAEDVRSHGFVDSAGKGAK